MLFLLQVLAERIEDFFRTAFKSPMSMIVVSYGSIKSPYTFILALCS